MNSEQLLDYQMENIHIVFQELGYKVCPECGEKL
jgi:uncharacterized protein (UPF0212 family)